MSELRTPHAGDDKAEDDDVVALLMRQHGDIRNLFDEVEATGGEERRDAFRRPVRLPAVHETAEEEVVHPFARKGFPMASVRSPPSWTAPRTPSARPWARADSASSRPAGALARAAGRGEPASWTGCLPPAPRGTLRP